jgi:hypothetical protein
MSSWLRRIPATSLIAGVLLLAAMNTYATVLCIRHNGSRALEEADWHGRCATCPADTGQPADQQRSSSETCIDLPILLFSAASLTAMSEPLAGTIQWLLPVQLPMLDTTTLLRPPLTVRLLVHANVLRFVSPDLDRHVVRLI